MKIFFSQHRPLIIKTDKSLFDQHFHFTLIVYIEKCTSEWVDKSVGFRYFFRTQVDTSFE